MDAQARQQRSRLAGYARAAKYDSVAVTAPGRLAAERRFREQVQSWAAAHGEQLSEKEIERRATALRKAHFARITLLSLQARAKKKRPEKKTAVGRDSQAVKPAKKEAKNREFTTANSSSR